MHSGRPVGVAALVGREHDRARVAELLADARVVTLIGSGGCGKTRLAVEVVGDVASRFPDGVAWVELDSVADPAGVAPAVGAALGVPVSSPRSLVDTVAGQFRGRRLLLAMDNCEHQVAAAAPLVSALISACPLVRVLATSRVRLAVDGEALFEVAPLPVPAPGVSSASAVAAAEAARLFEVRARQVATDFRITEDNAAAVADVCRRLDGIPLAIELAAGRVRVLAPDQIATRLSDRFGLLADRTLGAPARQRTLEASVDWSYDLLDDVQRLALARLSVFAGSFELDAAEALVAGPGIDGSAVLDLVAGLVDQSMVQVVHRHNRARYRLLETIKVYARRRLPQLDDPARVRDAHLRFFARLAQRASTGLHSSDPEPWVSRLTADLSDLRAALDWAASVEDVRGVLDLTEPIVRFWFERGLPEGAHHLLRTATDNPGASGVARVRAWNTAAALAFGSYEPARFHRSAGRAVAAARADGGDGALAVALAQRALSGALSGLSTNDETEADVTEALQLGTRCSEASIEAYVLQFAGAAVLHRRSILAGYRLLQQAVEVCEANDLTFHLPAAHGGAAAWLPWSGRLDETRRHALQAIEQSRQLGRPGWEAVGFTGLAAVAVLRGDLRRAQDWLASAHAALHPRALQTHYGMWLRHWHCLCAVAAGDMDAARATADEVVVIGRGGGSRLDEAIGEWLLGMVARRQQRLDDARVHLDTARLLSTDPPLPQTLGRSLLGLADLALENEDPEEAWVLAHTSLDVLGRYDDLLGVASALEVIADLVRIRGDPAQSLRLLGASQRFHDELRIVPFPLEMERVARARDTGRALLGPVAATASWDTGRRMSLADAVALARRGRGRRRRPKIGWAALTPVEVDVVRLVSDGCTNAQIAEHMFISVNTVKTHLTHVYAKVDVEGRADLAAQVARRHL